MTMTKESEPQIFRQLRVDMKVGSVLGHAYQQVPQRRVWIHTGDPPVVTAFDLSQRSQYSRDKSYITLRAFVGRDPPEDLLDWHLGVRLESVPRILTVSGKQLDELPRHLEEWGDANKVETDAEKIAQAAALVFGQMRTPEDIVALTQRLAASDPRAPRILGLTVSGQQALGIRIT